MTFQTWYDYYKYYIILLGLFNAQINFENNNNKIIAKKLDCFIIV